jgi:hypothetical protein
VNYDVLVRALLTLLLAVRKPIDRLDAALVRGVRSWKREKKFEQAERFEMLNFVRRTGKRLLVCSSPFSVSMKTKKKTKKTKKKKKKRRRRKCFRIRTKRREEEI